MARTAMLLVVGPLGAEAQGARSCPRGMTRWARCECRYDLVVHVLDAPAGEHVVLVAGEEAATRTSVTIPR